MIVRRLAAAGGAAALLWLAAPSLPAAAHGTAADPISRSLACAGGGEKTSAAACKAALAANGGAFGVYDAVKVANVNGDDRKFVPDGSLCSGGLAAYKGLDLARSDFPATTVTGGTTLQIKYQATVAHQGSFRVYLTRQGYSPLAKLTWSDLGSAPLLNVANPPLQSGSFRMSVKLPVRTGRQMLYIVWETSNTPDTYYSCSDLAFSGPPSPTHTPAEVVTHAAAKPAATAKRTVPTATTAAAAAPSPSSSPSPDVSVDSPVVAQPKTEYFTRAGDESRATIGHSIIAVGVLLAAGAIAWATVARFLSRRARR